MLNGKTYADKKGTHDQKWEKARKYDVMLVKISFC
jgi:hypothetical protein